MQRFLWERGASVGADFDLFCIENLYMHMNSCKTLRERGKKQKKAEHLTPQNVNSTGEN